jgi:hypothetical protein
MKYTTATSAAERWRLAGADHIQARMHGHVIAQVTQSNTGQQLQDVTSQYLTPSKKRACLIMHLKTAGTCQ